MSTVTVDEVMSWEPCKEYPRERVTALFADRETITALDVLEMDIPAEDRLWAVLREEMVPAPILHEFACRCAEAALMQERKAGREPDPRSWAAIEAKRKWMRGEIDDNELRAARDTAWDAAQDVAGAWDTAWVAAWFDAGDAAWFAACVTTQEAARNEQCVMLRDIIRKSNTK